MYDGEQVSSMVAVLPETFTALPEATENDPPADCRRSR
jgi:hypothetical protein